MDPGFDRSSLIADLFALSITSYTVLICKVDLPRLITPEDPDL
jgi:hypothetical protein